MKIHLRDILLFCVVVGVGLAWWKDATSHKAEILRLQRDLEAAEAGLNLRDHGLLTAHAEADILAEEVRRLRGVVKSSIDDQRQWFALEVEGKKLVAIKTGTSQANVLTLEMLKCIEDETGMEAPRLRHFLTPISELRWDGQNLRDTEREKRSEP